MTAISQQVTVNDWSKGWIAKPEPWELPLNALGYAQNVNLRNGRIEPMRGLGEAVADAGGLAPYRFIHKATQAIVEEVGPTDHVYWYRATVPTFGIPLTRYVPELDLWVDQVMVLPAFLSTAVPPLMSLVVLDGGTPDLMFTMVGVPVPDDAPSAGTSPGGNITAVDTQYVYTWIDLLGYESAPSPPSDLITLDNENANVQVYAPDDPDIDEWFAGWRIYRNVNGTYLLAGEVGWSAGDPDYYTFLDDKPGNQLGESLTTAGHAPAPPLHGLAWGSHNGEWAGFHDTVFYRTEPGQPDNWLIDEAVNLDSKITAAIGTNWGWLVLTESKAALITGSGLGTTVNRDYAPYGCPMGATWTCVKTSLGWVWWSRQGLALWNGAGVTLLTRGAFSDEQIALLNPDGSDVMALQATYHDDEYLLFHKCGCLRMDLRDGSPVFTTACITADALHVDRQGTLYVADDDRNDVRIWKDGDPMPIVVQSGEFVAPSERDRFHVHGARIRYSGGSLRAQWYQGEAKHGPELDVSANGLLWCPRGAWDRTSLELWGTATIHAITFNPFSEAAQ